MGLGKAGSCSPPGTVSRREGTARAVAATIRGERFSAELSGFMAERRGLSSLLGV